MAGAQCAIISSFTPRAISTTIRNNVITPSSSSPFVIPLQYPSKRKNYLRPKIIKTLTKPKIIKTVPILPNESSSLPIIHIESDETSHGNDVVTLSEETVAESPPVIDEATEETNGIIDVAGVTEGGTFKFDTKLVLKVGICFVGLFVFQTIVAVWLLGSADSNKEPEKSSNKSSVRALETSKNGNGIWSMFKDKSALKYNSLGKLDEDLERKIVEIRAMARDVRMKEKREGKKNGVITDFDGDEDSEVIKIASVKVKSGIEKEVDAKLVNLKKKLNSAQEKSLGLPVGSLSLSEKVEKRTNDKNSDKKQLNVSDTLLFEKKTKFRSQVTKPMRDDPKGFRGFSSDRKGTKKKKGSSVAIDVRAGSGSIGNFQVELETMKEGAGVVQGKNHEKQTAGESKSIESRELETPNSSSSGKEGKGVPASSSQRNVPISNGSLKARETGSKPVSNNVKVKPSKTDNDSWWWKLPCVFAILLRRSSDPESPGGLYTLKNTYLTPNKSGLAYTVAFEDRGDANNFCYLLESFFENLGDFSADIIPLSTNEVREDVKSLRMELIVVKKGQLKLYAGQPLDDVEKDLRLLAQ